MSGESMAWGVKRGGGGGGDRRLTVNRLRCNRKTLRPCVIFLNVTVKLRNP